ncbi:MAG: hypothetical protein ABIS35_00225 [Terracoccus sp.]
MRFEVEVAAVAADATGAGDAWTVLRDVAPGADLLLLAQAFPGGRVAAATPALEREWEQQLTRARTRVWGLGAALTEAARAYTDLETAVRAIVGGPSTKPR